MAGKWKYWEVDGAPMLLLRSEPGNLEKLTTEGWKLFGNYRTYHERAEEIGNDAAYELALKINEEAAAEIKGA